jgi:hypothetical protein
VNTDESDPTANTAPFEVFVIHADGSLLLVPNTINMSAQQNIPSFAAIGPQAVAGSGQYFYVASIDNDPNDGMYYMTSGAVYGYEIASEGRFTTAGRATASAFFPTGNNFCSDAFIAGAPDGNYVYAFGVEDQANVILPFRINKGLAARDLK